MKKISTTLVKRFQDTIYHYYQHNKRSFPWRETANPYHILISEVMLQQTQVQRVITKYNEFIAAFPSVEILARATLAEVYQVWQGMGYNRRALYLQKTAESIVKKYVSTIPKTVEELQKLPGIGYNTSCAIVAFAFNKPVVFIETNIRSVFIHEFGRSIPRFSAPMGALPRPVSSPPQAKPDRDGESQVAQNEYFRPYDSIDDKDILPLIEQTLDQKNPREWYWALMDYGAYLKKKYPNPSRKSKHYNKQSRFEGSNRQLRGKILKFAAKHPNLTKKKLYQLLKEDRDRIDEILTQMEKEGFVVIKKSHLYLT